MALDIPHLAPKPGWAVQSVVDPTFAKLGGLLSSPEDLAPGGFAFLGIPFEGLTINPIGGKGGPDGLRAAAYILTVNAWAMDGLKDILWYGGGLTDVLPEVGVLLGITAAALALGAWRFRWS